MENCEKCAEMFSKKPKHAQILLKSQLSAHKCCKCKIVLQFRLPSFRALLAPRISRGHFFLANFFRVTHDGLSERGTTRSLVQCGSERARWACLLLARHCLHCSRRKLKNSQHHHVINLFISKLFWSRELVWPLSWSITTQKNEANIQASILTDKDCQQLMYNDTVTVVE